MPVSLIEQLTTNFYKWERRGRGWECYSSPVDLEPPFYPFFYHALPQVSVIDDGKKPSIFGMVANLFQKTPESAVIEEEEPLEPYPFLDDSPLHVLAVSLPKGCKVKVEQTEQLLVMLSYCNAPISFEIIAGDSFIRIQFVCRAPDVRHMDSQLKAYFPEAVVSDKTETVYDPLADGLSGFAIDLGLKDEFTRPLAMATSFELDPFTGLFGILDSLNDYEQAVVQIQFKGTVNSWAESILRSVMDNNGGSFFIDAPEMVPLAKEKISSPLFAVSVRTIGQSLNAPRAQEIARSVASGLINLSCSDVNRLIPLSNDNHNPETYQDAIVLRQSLHLGMLLNAGELANLVHLPSSSVTSSKLEREIKRTKTAPSIAEGHDFVLGINVHQGKEKVVSLANAQRLKHTHVIGATGTGKSTLLLNLIVKDIELGNGIAVLDPHGDLIESIIPRIPLDRAEDAIIIDPSDSDYPVGFNILTAHSDIEKEILSSDLVAGFRRLSTSWGDQMNSVFANAILAFLESEKGGTLIDVRRFLIEKSFRDTFLKTVSDPNVIYYWQKEFPLLKSSSIGPILTRLDTFLRPKLIRNMVAQQKSIDFENALDSKKILLVKLSQGLIGTENSYLLGTFIVSKIHQAAMARQAKSKEERNNFFLYIDEFQNFITPSMAAILSGARKYHLGLILAHQDMQQLVKQDSELASSVTANAGTRISFRVGDTDARKFEDGFSFFDANDLRNLETGEAVVRIERPEFDFNLQITPLPEPEIEAIETITNYIVARSNEKYGTPRNQVEGVLKGMQDESVEVDIAESPKTTRSVQREPKEKPSAEEVKVVTPISLDQEQQTISTLIHRKEQTEHRYLQSLIKRMAELRGFKASIEEPIPNGKGRVDVLLERNRKRIACEVAMTTTEDWEVHNVEKCLFAGYETIVVCSTDKQNLQRIQQKVQEKIDTGVLPRVLTFEPEALFFYLDQQIAKEAGKEERIKGYRVKVEYNAVSAGEAEQKKANVLKAIADSMRKKTDT